MVVLSDEAPSSYVDQLVGNDQPWRSSTKINLLIRIIKNVLDENKEEKVVVFSQWTSMLTLIEYKYFVSFSFFSSPLH